MNPPADGDLILRCQRRPLGAVTADPSAPHWARCPVLELRETVSGQPPLQKTRLQIAWDERELRVLFCVEDDYVWATLNERDAPLYNEEVVEVFLDPAGDLAAYYEFEVNPLNAVLDLELWREASGWKKDFQWRCEGLQTAVQTNATGWSAEFSIPFAALGAVPGDKPWRANFYRIDRPAGTPWELSAWSPTGAPSFHVPARFGLLEFAE